MKRKINKKDKGITLVTLVITIIIILILTAITLGTAIGKNGLIDKTKQAVDTYKKEEEKETKTLTKLSSLIENEGSSDNGENITISKEDLKELKEEILNEIKNDNSKNPTGTVISYMGNNPPEGYLNCDGTTYNISDYPELAEQIKQEFQSYSYFGGNGTTTFAVPNLQGEFLRGYSKSATSSKTNGVTTAKVGMNQQGTKYTMDGSYAESATSYFIGAYIGTDGLSNNTNRNQDTNIGSSVGIAIVDGYNSYVNTDEFFLRKPTAYTGRPTNTSVLYCIKY